MKLMDFWLHTYQDDELEKFKKSYSLKVLESNNELIIREWFRKVIGFASVSNHEFLNMLKVNNMDTADFEQRILKADANRDMAKDLKEEHLKKLPYQYTQLLLEQAISVDPRNSQTWSKYLKLSAK